MSMFRGYDKGVMKEYWNDGRTPAGEIVLLKICTGTIAGDPTKGTAKTFSYQIVRDKAVITSVAQNDVVQSGGIYQIGDIHVQLLRKLTPIDDKLGLPGDRLIWKGHEYRQVGNIVQNHLEHYVLYDYTFRRI